MSLEAAIQLAHDLANAKDSPLYKFLLRRTMEEGVRAAEKLAVADAGDQKAIRSLQDEIARYRNFVTWIDTAIAEGIQAEALLTASDGGDEA